MSQKFLVSFGRSQSFLGVNQYPRELKMSCSRTLSLHGGGRYDCRAKAEYYSLLLPRHAAHAFANLLMQNQRRNSSHRSGHGAVDSVYSLAPRL